MLGMDMAGSRQPRSIKLFGEVCDEQSERIIDELIGMSLNSEQLVKKESEESSDEDTEEEYERIINPIDFMISTYGGNADDMFGIYDMMRLVREDVEIATTGVG